MSRRYYPKRHISDDCAYFGIKLINYFAKIYQILFSE